ncbi:MAG: hypothetical protein HYR85_05635 [Planctomycetes bacterium]|nr:hypothetical protein [Planctomycetota bacterium]
MTLNAARLALVLVVGLGRGDAREHVDTPNVSVDFPAGKRSFADATARFFVEARDDLAAKLGVPYSRTATVQLFDDDAGFDAAVSGHRIEPWVAAVAIPSEARIVVRGTTPEAHLTEEFVPLLRHEVCHLLVGATAIEGRTHVPVWFDEGLAQWAADRLVVAEADVAILDRYGFLAPFVQLDERFPTNASDARIAYLQSESFVRFVVYRRGLDAVRETLRRVRRGEVFADAFDAGAGVRFFELEREWKQWLHDEFSLPYLIARSLPFFALVALVVVLTFVVRRFRDRRLLRRMALEESTTPIDEPGDEFDAIDEVRDP